MLDAPGLQLPWRQVLDPPLLHPRRAMRQARRFFDLGLNDDRHCAAAVLPRRFADHIDEFWFVGHGWLHAFPQGASLRRGDLTSRFQNVSISRQRSVVNATP